MNGSNNNNETAPIVIEKRNEHNQVVEVSPVRTVVYSKQTSVTATTVENPPPRVIVPTPVQPQQVVTLTVTQSSNNVKVLKASGPSTSTLPVKPTIDGVKPSLATSAAAHVPSTSNVKAKAAIAPVAAITKQNSSVNLLQQQQTASKVSEQTKEAANAPVVNNTPKKQTQSNVTGQTVLQQLLEPLPVKPSFNKIVWFWFNFF